MSGTIIRKIISSANAPRPVGPYSQAIQVGQTVYVSGVLGIDKISMQLAAGGAKYEMKQALKNLDAILLEADSCTNNVIKAVILLDDINDFSLVNDIYKETFKEPYPARTTFQVGKLPLGAKVEIEVIAISGLLETK